MDKSRHQKKQFRRNCGAPKGYNNAIVLDAFEFWGRDIGEERYQFYKNSVGKPKGG